MNLKDFMNLAVKILENKDTEYYKNREIISKLFEGKKEASLEIVKLRLAVIDSFYSTNMGKRLYGLEDLANKINDLGSDQELKEKLKQYINNHNPEKRKELNSLFSCKEIGIHKKGDNSGNAKSLISKYFYFVSGRQFPIDDSLVRENINIIVNKFTDNKKILSNKHKGNVIESLIDLRKELFADNNDNIIFSKIDNLMWLYGKIKKGSLSLILRKDKYQQFIGSDDYKNKKNIIDCLNDNSTLNSLQEKGILSNDLKKFIEEMIKINSFDRAN